MSCVSGSTTVAKPAAMRLRASLAGGPVVVSDFLARPRVPLVGDAAGAALLAYAEAPAEAAQELAR